LRLRFAKRELKRLQAEKETEKNTDKRKSPYADMTLVGMFKVPISREDKRALDDKAEQRRVDKERKEQIKKRYKDAFPGRTLHL
jgi:hypothetical protein